MPAPTASSARPAVEIEELRRTYLTTTGTAWPCSSVVVCRL
ncbi:MAG: hypothetical protein M0027_12845 [Candidatus Dormibacteraeota bacterium]|nr:hypothetical protein [Candidatus Dormibacteraeota bacterium]